MIDIISEINYELIRMKKEKENLKKEYESKISDIDKKIVEYCSCINLLKDIVSSITCSRCGGSGVVRCVDAAGDVETKCCPSCEGRGVNRGMVH